MKFGKILPFVVGLFPVMALAQDINTERGLGDFIQDVLVFINAYIIPLIIALAVLVFIWGVLKYVISKDDDTKKEARGVMIWGIIAIFVMVSVWGLVNLLGNTFSLDKSITLPIVPETN